MRSVRSFSAERAEADCYAALMAESRALSSRFGIGIALFHGGFHIFSSGLVLGVLWQGEHEVAAGRIQRGDLMSFLMLASTMQRSLQSLAGISSNVWRALAAGERICETINMTPAISLTGGERLARDERARHVCMLRAPVSCARVRRQR